MTGHPKDADVPCNGCTACCRNELIVLMPEDSAWMYDTRVVINPLDGKPARALLQTAAGACIYLGDGGCTIHDLRPAVCRAFDCRRLFVSFGSRAERRRAVREGQIDGAVLRAGQARVRTLKVGEQV